MNICANCRHYYIDDYDFGLDRYSCKTYVYIGRISGFKCENYEEN